MKKQEQEAIYEYHLHADFPGKMQFEVQPLQDLIQDHQDDIAKPHIHSFYQIIWFKKGNGKHFVDFNEYDVSENTIFFIAKNQVHAFDSNRDYEGFAIHFSEDFLVQKENDVDFFLKCSMFNNPYQIPSCCVGTGNEYKLDEYIVQMQTELNEHDKYGQEELLRLYLKAFLIQVQRRKYELEELNKGLAPFIVDEKRTQLIHFVNLIEENYTKGLPASKYAEMLFVSLRTLSNLTLQLLNKKPSEMIHERIVLEAKRLLLHSELNVNQIADKLGFEDSSYFIRYFKKYTSQSPTSFRKSFQ
ncbi:helix-turn-helix domain-containing protein [Sphingobacterium athyrii]|uniref:AraC family transcriptional regulator n=1 Tax=Sphingobacterium athyrii TaxID=2152717 RepID=A0A363NUU2_9SPHI|nr:helix-turn-helix domain-containing protein [Sphingobacterium athyrii]PUV24510.1 AraC family transcriptional regulator [Sphingobacterium athyrii]